MKSIKVIGISGSGKTTLIREALRIRPGLFHLSYSELLRQYGSAGVDSAWREALSARWPLYLTDEHLEFGDGDLIGQYRAEGTSGLLFLDVSPARLLLRRLTDLTRIRDESLERIVIEAETAGMRAKRLADGLNVPLITLTDTSVRDGLNALFSLTD